MELSFTVSQWFRPSPHEIGIEPPGSRLKTLKTLDCFQSSVEMRIVELNQVGIVGAARQSEVGEQDIAPVPDIPEDIFKDGMVEGMMFEHMCQSTLDTLGIPPFSEDMPSERGEEVTILFLGSDPQVPPDILQIVIVAYLEHSMGKDLVESLFDACPVIDNHYPDVIAKGMQLLKKVRERHLILGNVQMTVGNIMGQIVDGVDERNLGRKAFDSYILAIDDEDTAETFGITERLGEERVVWQLVEFCNDPGVGLFARQLVFISKFSKRDSVDMFYPQGRERRNVVTSKDLLTDTTKKAMGTPTLTILDRFQASTAITTGAMFFLTCS